MPSIADDVVAEPRNGEPGFWVPSLVFRELVDAELEARRVPPLERKIVALEQLLEVATRTSSRSAGRVLELELLVDEAHARELELLEAQTSPWVWIGVGAGVLALAELVVVLVVLGR